MVFEDYKKSSKSSFFLHLRELNFLQKYARNTYKSSVLKTMAFSDFSTFFYTFKKNIFF